MRAAIWARVSTDRQEVDNQLRELRAYAARRHWEVVKVYEVEASGWTGKQRRDLDGAWEDGRQGVYEVLLSWALDRLTREGVEATIREANRFAREGLILASYNEPWVEELTGPLRELLLAFHGWMARQESARRSERVKAGMARAREQGRRLGRPVRRPVEQMRRWPEVRDLVLAGTLTRAEGSRRLHVRYRDFLAALNAFRNGDAADGRSAEFMELS